MMSESMTTDDNDDQLDSKEDIKKEVEFVDMESESKECIICVTRNVDSYDIFTSVTTTSGTPIHAFLSKYTNTELPFSKEFVKYICKTCLDLVNSLERASTGCNTEFLKLKSDFELIISKNPLFHLSWLECVKNEPVNIYMSEEDKRLLDIPIIPEPHCQLEVKDVKIERCSNGSDDFIDTIVKLEPLSDDPNAEDIEQKVKEEPIVGTKPKAKGRAKKSQKQESTPNSKPLEEERKHQCTVCQRRFKLKHHLKEHLRIHTGEKAFHCDICAYMCARKDDFTKHLRMHTGEKPYQCNVCLHRFNHKNHLVEHYRTHTGDRPFKCDICQSTFGYRHVLKSHYRIHTDEKPYECMICQRRFNQRSHLTSHITIHTGEKSYECEICQSRFNRRSGLKEHLQIHVAKSFECHICHKRYNQSGNLKKHLKSHLSEKPFVCDICQRSFIYNHLLRRHLKSHSDDKVV